MAQFLQQNWLWVILIGGMLAMHFGGHRHGGQPGHGGGTHGGCGGHAAHGTPGREEHQDHEPPTRGQAPGGPGASTPGSTSVHDAP
jgi:hypothetical protein